VLWHLDQGAAAVYELGFELGLAGDAPQPAEAGARWQWLTRPWPTAPPLANGDGMPRGIGCGSAQPHLPGRVHHLSVPVTGPALVLDGPTLGCQLWHVPDGGRPKPALRGVVRVP
jgi:hypothetical protein